VALCQICLILLLLYKRHTHTHARLTAPFPGLPGWAGTRKVIPIWILLKQETVSGSGISWATCKSAPRSRHITTPTPHHSGFYRSDALPAAQPTVSKHWRLKCHTFALYLLCLLWQLYANCLWQTSERINREANLSRSVLDVLEQKIVVLCILPNTSVNLARQNAAKC